MRVAADYRDRRPSTYRWLYRSAHPAGHLQESQPEDIELALRPLGAGELCPQRAQEPVRGRVPQQAELVGEETGIPEAIGGQCMLDVFDVVLALSTVDVGVIDQ